MAVDWDKLRAKIVMPGYLTYPTIVECSDSFLDAHHALLDGTVPVDLMWEVGSCVNQNLLAALLMERIVRRYL
jgi:hypothetical protein